MSAAALRRPGAVRDGMENFKELIRQKLSSGPLRVLEEAGRPRAAVLVSIFQQNRQPYFLLTLRTQYVATHKGQISFPGGMFDDEDQSLRATAIRETCEELGILPEQVEILGRFHDCVSVNNYLVTPYVGFLQEGFTLLPNPREVEQVLQVPLDFFHRTQPARQFREREGKRVTLYFYHYEGHVIWGLTARIIKDLLEFLEQ